MDDLSGLHWSKPDGAEKQQPCGLPSPASATSRPKPPVPERPSPSTYAVSNVPPHTQTPSNDSFSTLVAFSSASTNKNRSLREQQKELLEQKAQHQAAKQKQLESQYSGGDEQFWNNLGTSGQTTPAPPGQLPLVSDAQPPNQGGLDWNGTKTRRSSQPNPEDEEADILAAFEADAPVASSSHFPKPFERVDGSIDAGGTKPSTTSLSGDAAQGPIPQHNHAFDDDDPFGLAELPRRHAGRASESTPSNEEDNVLGLLAKPVSELPRAQPAHSPPAPAERKEIHPQHQAMAELMEMGFPAEKAMEALESTESGTDVQQAVGWLLSKAHLESSGKARPRRSSNEGFRQSRGSRIDRRSGSRSSMVQSGGSEPARSKDQSRERQVRHASAVPVNQLESDPTQLATELRTAFFRTAGSFWKTSTKKVQQAVQDFNSDSDSSQPKWMREPDTSRSNQRTDHGNEDGTTASPRGRISAKTGQESVTDEAMMLQSDRARPTRQKPQRPQGASLDSSADSSRDHSPAMPPRSRQEFPAQPAGLRQQKFKPQARADSKATLNRQAIDDQASQAYISSARRRKPAPKPPVSESEPDLLDDTSLHQRSYPPGPATTRPSQHGWPFQLPVSTKVCPPALSRSIPPISSIALQASHADREAGNDHFKRGDYSAAHRSYTSSLQQLPSDHPIAIVLHANRAVAALKIGEPKSAILDSNRAIAIIGPSRGEAESIDLNHGAPAKPMREYLGKALMRKAEALEHMEKWKEAAAVWQEAVEGGHGGATSIQGRIRCGKAAVPQQPQPAKSFPKKPITSKLSRPATSRPNGSADPIPPAAAVNRLRAANAAADKIDDERFTLADAVDARLAAWKGGRADNLRALLGSLETVLWPEAGWRKIGMAELVLPAKVKVQYMKGIGKVHPDKLPTTATTEQRMIAGAVFSTLNEAWDKFKNENGL